MEYSISIEEIHSFIRNTNKEYRTGSEHELHQEVISDLLSSELDNVSSGLLDLVHSIASDSKLEELAEGRYITVDDGSGDIWWCLSEDWPF